MLMPFQQKIKKNLHLKASEYCHIRFDGLTIVGRLNLGKVFLMRLRISVRDRVRPSAGPSVAPLLFLHDEYGRKK